METSALYDLRKKIVILEEGGRSTVFFGFMCVKCGCLYFVSSAYEPSKHGGSLFEVGVLSTRTAVSNWSVVLVLCHLIFLFSVLIFRE